MVVFTAIFGDYDRPVKPLHRGECRHVLFTDRNVRADGWEVRVVARRFSNPARENRSYKLQPHKLFPGERTVYIDGHIHLLMTPEALLSEVQGRAGRDYSVFALAHTLGHTVEGEFAWVRDKGMVAGDVLDAQWERYERLGVPAALPTAQAPLLVSRPDSEAFYDAWWLEVRDYGYRDQLSFPYARWVTGADVFLVDRPNFHTLFRHRPHVKRQLVAAR